MAPASSADGSVALNLNEPADPVLQGLASAGHSEYVRLYTAAATARRENTLAAVEALGAVQRAPCVDRAGRPVFLFYPSRLAAGGASGVTLERVTAHALLLMHEHVVARGGEYAVVWVTNNLEPDELGWRWFVSTYRMVPHAYHKQMRSLSVVHPAVSTRLTLLALSYLLRASFWDKLVYADRVEFLDEVVESVAALDLPAGLLEYDRFLDREMAATTAQAEGHAGGFGLGAALGGGGGLGLGFGGGGGAMGGPGGDPLGIAHGARFEEWRAEERRKEGGGAGGGGAGGGRRSGGGAAEGRRRAAPFGPPHASLGRRSARPLRPRPRRGCVWPGD